MVKVTVVADIGELWHSLNWAFATGTKQSAAVDADPCDLAQQSGANQVGCDHCEFGRFWCLELRAGRWHRHIFGWVIILEFRSWGTIRATGGILSDVLVNHPIITPVL